MRSNFKSNYLIIIINKKTDNEKTYILARDAFIVDFQHIMP